MALGRAVCDLVIFMALERALVGFSIVSSFIHFLNIMLKSSHVRLVLSRIAGACRDHFTSTMLSRRLSCEIEFYVGHVGLTGGV